MLQSRLRALREAQDDLELDAEGSRDLDAELRTLEAQVESPRPNTLILRESLASVKRVLESRA